MSYPSFKIDFPLNIKKRIKSNLDDVVESGRFSSGKYVNKCEALIKDITKSPFVFAVNSGSSALEACAYALKKAHGLGKVLIPENTFIATALAFERQGFEIQFYENDIGNVFENENELKDCIGLVVVDLGGIIPLDIKEVVKDAHKRGLWVCEDACQAFGSSLNGKSAGTFADIGALSFFSTKVFTSGEGGAVITSNPVYANLVNMYRSFGKSEDWVTIHYEKGWNCRMNEFGAAVLEPQLANFNKIISDRQRIMRVYYNEFPEMDDYDLNLLVGAFDMDYNGYKIIGFLNEALDKDRFIELCKKDGVNFQGNVYDFVLSEQPVYAIGVSRSIWEGSWEENLKRMICLPCWFGMSKKEIYDVVKIIKKNLKIVRKEVK